MDLLSPARNCTEIRVGESGRVHRARGGVFTVDDRVAPLLRAAGCGPRISQPVGCAVWACGGCGFRAVIGDRPCPRCGGSVAPEVDA